MMSKEEAKIHREIFMLKQDHTPRIGASLRLSEPKKCKVFGNKSNIPDLNVELCSDPEEEEKQEILKTFQNLAGFKLHDVCYVEPRLLYELETEIIACLPCCEYWKMQMLNKQFLQLLKSCEIFRVRQERELVKPYVFLRSSGDRCWTMFDENFKNFMRLPEIPSDDFCFYNSDMETISVGTQVIVIGMEIKGIVIWRYEIENQKWFKGPSMITPRALFASASHGAHAFFAGGIHIDENCVHMVVNTAEKYNADTKMWTVIRVMHKPRKYSSGCFLRGKFYVIGGRGENDEYLTCGERYDEAKNCWELIPDMLKHMTFTSSQPPLIAVVRDNLYSLETSSNDLRVYDISTNVWKKLGVVPLNAALGWGVAFKSIGDRLLVVGASQYWNRTSIYTCCPSPDIELQRWEELKQCCHGVQLDQFIENCCVMFA